MTSDYGYRVLVTGSRTWRSPQDRQILRDALDQLLVQHLALTVVHGDCSRGADFLAARWAAEAHARGALVLAEAHPAAWGECSPACPKKAHRLRRTDGEEYCPRAGTYRNELMVNLGAHECLAFIRGNSAGASHCARLAERAGIPVRRWAA